ncbi:MAG TPA: nickel-dependent lactate racemase [Firmicutes bacterium]|nr:nickel-dependent lactate racemase [Bacillota bacterium]
MKREFSLPYGTQQITCTMMGSKYAGTYLPSKDEVGGLGESKVIHALNHPIGAPPLAHLLSGNEQVVIVTSDHTRPCPNAVVLPPLLAALNGAGIPDGQITVVIALGLHRMMTEDELRQSVGDEVFRRVRVINHDRNDVVSLGTTSRGTPVELFRPVVEADFRICVGNVEFHYFAGFSGGVKAIMPGVASKDAVKANHAHMIEEGALAAELAGNPVREDLEEAVRLLGAHYLLNVIVDEQHNIGHACAGDVTLAHRELCERLITGGLVRLPEKVDLAIVSAGGYPKDIDLYQAQKALDNCANAVKPGGVMVLVAECGEGYGNATFQSWMTSGKTPSGLLADLQTEFVLGGHKAAAIAKVAQKITIILVSEAMSQEEMVGLTVVKSCKEALEKAVHLLEPDFSYAVFPLGASTLPKVKSEV